MVDEGRVKLRFAGTVLTQIIGIMLVLAPVFAHSRVRVKQFRAGRKFYIMRRGEAAKKIGVIPLEKRFAA